MPDHPGLGRIVGVNEERQPDRGAEAMRVARRPPIGNVDELRQLAAAPVRRVWQDVRALRAKGIDPGLAIGLAVALVAWPRDGARLQAKGIVGDKMAEDVLKDTLNSWPTGGVVRNEGEALAGGVGV